MPDPAFGWSRNLRGAEPVIDAARRELDRAEVRQGQPGVSKACACSGKHWTRFAPRGFPR